PACDLASCWRSGCRTLTSRGQRSGSSGRLSRPKTDSGSRSPRPNTASVLCPFRPMWSRSCATTGALLETRLIMRLGKPDADTLLFAEPDGEPTPPRRLTTRWRDACTSLELPRVSFHALRHTHASLLIAKGHDVVRVSRRMGHAKPTVTLNIYGHLFRHCCGHGHRGSVDVGSPRWKKRVIGALRCRSGANSRFVHGFASGVPIAKTLIS